MSIAFEIRRARGDRTAVEIATICGIHKSYLCDIEAGRRVPPPYTIQLLANALEVSPDRWLWLWAVEHMGEYRARLAVVYGYEQAPSAAEASEPARAESEGHDG